MSDHWIHIIPEQPDFVPEKERREAAVLYFKEIAPKSDEVKVEVSEELKFIHCGENYSGVFCPSCKAEIEDTLWGQWMEEDYQQKIFVLNEHTMPCCEARHTLHELSYEWPMGFTHCNIEAMNPNLGKLTDAQRARFEKILGCPIRIIYTHI